MRRLLVLLLFALPAAAQGTLVDDGRAALEREDLQAALRTLQAAVAQSPQSADAHYLLGVTYGKLAEKANIFRQPTLARHARDEFERAVAINPDHLDARRALVEYYTRAPAVLGGSKAKALQHAQEIARIQKLSENASR